MEEKIIDLKLTYDELDFLISNLYSDDKETLIEVSGEGKYKKLFDTVSQKIAKEKRVFLRVFNEFIIFYSL